MPIKPPPSSNADKYYAEYENGARGIAQYGLGNTTCIHRIGSCISLEKPEDKRMFFDILTKNGTPAYIIGAANNIGAFNDYARGGYVQLRSEQKEAMLGQWGGPGGVIYRDVLMVASGISAEQALKYKKTVCPNINTGDKKE